MPTFAYKAKKGPQEIIEGTIEAQTKDLAISKIDQMGYVPIHVSVKAEEFKASERKIKVNKAKLSGSLKLFQRVRSRDLTVFTEKLASLLKSKVPLFEAINIISTQTENVPLKKIVTSISNELKDGNTFSNSLKNYSNVFPSLYINMVRSGESGGVLEETLRRLAKFRQEEEDLKAKVVSALAYPLFIPTSNS